MSPERDSGAAVHGEHISILRLWRISLSLLPHLARVSTGDDKGLQGLSFKPAVVSGSELGERRRVYKEVRQQGDKETRGGETGNQKVKAEEDSSKEWKKENGF